MRISHCGGGCALFYLRFCQFLLYVFWGSGDLQGPNQEMWTWPSLFFVSHGADSGLLGLTQVQDPPRV